MRKSPNVWNLGDTALVRSGNQQVPVTIKGFISNLVEIQYADGRLGRRPHGALTDPDS